MKETTQNQEAHVFAYLPYKLKCTRIKWDNKFVKDFGIKELIGLLYNTNRECFVGIFQNTELDINQIVPCLHPLSDLTKEIEVNGEKFIPIVELAEKESANNNIYVKDIHSSKDIFWVDFENSEEDEFRFCYCINSFQKGKLNPNSHTFVQNQIELWNMLLSWHFDIFGLIDAGLAVDINTVKF